MPLLGRIILYAADVEATVSFYSEHFGFEPLRLEGDRIVELVPRDGGAAILVHKAAKGQRKGQSIVKLVFDVPDVAAFCEESAARGLEFGAIHKGDGYAFANARDPGGNSVSISSRAFRTEDAG